LRCHLVQFSRRLPFATLKKMFGERLGIPNASWRVMANSWRFNLTLVLAILPFTVTLASRAFADCAVSTLTVPASQWSGFIDGFDPRILPEVDGTVLRSIRIYWIGFGTLTALGLRPNDGIAAINSKTVGGDAGIGSAEKFLSERLAHARRTCELNVLVERRGVARSFRAVCDAANERSPGTRE
jgi:hypothetical protein